MARPHIRIIEQPAEKSFRFRYESEGRLSGSLFGERNTAKNVSYPKIEINNFTGKAVVIVSCVTKEKNRADKFLQHPHKLSSKNKMSPHNDENIGGVYTLRKQVNQSAVIEFKDIGIIFVKRENIKSSLEERKQKRIDPTRGGWEHMNMQQLIDLHSVRLCFQVLYLDETATGDNQYKQIGFVVSNPIMDKKSHGSLKIVELSASKTSVMGGERLILLCDHVKQKDISIVFYEEDNDKNIVWRKELNYENSQTLRVHHQYAISFITPSYRDIDIFEPRNTFIQLYRPSDQASSESHPFEFIPEEHSKLRRKKHKKNNKSAIIAANSYGQLNQMKNKPNYVPNIQENILVDANRKPSQIEAKLPVNEQPLIDLSVAEDKENRPNPNLMQPYSRGQNACHVPARPFEMQYNHYPPNAQLHNDNQYHYSQYTQHQNMNSYFDELNNPQPQYNSRPMHMPPHIHQHLQPYIPNGYTNEYAANEYGSGVRVNGMMNQPVHPTAYNVPTTYNENYNLQTPNRPVEPHVMNIKPSDTALEPNIPHLSDLVHQDTTELMNMIATSNIEKLTDSMNELEIMEM